MIRSCKRFLQIVTANILSAQHQRTQERSRQAHGPLNINASWLIYYELDSIELQTVSLCLGKKSSVATAGAFACSKCAKVPPISITKIELRAGNPRFRYFPFFNQH